MAYVLDLTENPDPTFPTDRQYESSDLGGPSDPLLDRGLREVITVSNNAMGAPIVILTICLFCSSRHRNCSASSCRRAIFRLEISFGEEEG